MLGSVVNAVRSGVNAVRAAVTLGAVPLGAVPLGLKGIKYFIDSKFRESVTPIPGSVLYCDLWVAAEHSGIYVGAGKISNIVVDGLAEASVCLNGPEAFTSKSTMGRKIYVSCDTHGAVGHVLVAEGAREHVGERSFYGLVFKNCHQFSTKCVNYAGENKEDSTFLGGILSTAYSMLPDETWERTMADLKQAARKKLGASKWRLWDWDKDAANNPPPEPDWQAMRDKFMNQALDPESIARIRAELAETKAYEAEIADENIPAQIRQELGEFRQILGEISQKYEEEKDFLHACQGASFSYAELAACGDDFSALSQQMQGNASIQALARKMGRNYISEEKKKQSRIPQASKSEVHGTHRSDDLMRLLPSELLNLEDETLEALFYARLLEKNLLSYELRGTRFVNREENETSKKRTGPVVACLDTSGSMQGKPLIKAKALLLSIAKILQEEDRSLHVLLFGSNGQLREFSMLGENNSAGLLKFLQQGFGGGTDFETPLKRALDIIETCRDYLKADILMISDGDCQLSSEFTQHLNDKKAQLDCSIYSVLCAGLRVADNFSDEVVVL